MKLRSIIGAALVVVGLSLIAFGVAARTFMPTPDLFDLNEQNVSNQNGAGNLPMRVLTKTIAPLQGVNTAVKNLILISAGQSNITNILPLFTATANPANLFNLNIYDSVIYSAGIEAMYGTSGNPGQGNPITYLMDQLVQAGKFANVIFMPVAISGSTVAQWGTGGAYSNRIPVAMRRLAQRGIVPGMTNVTFALVWGQGESDQGTSQAAYTASWNQMLTIAQAAGFSGRVFVAKQTYFNGIYGAGAQAAQTTNSPSGVINNGAGIYLGAVADSLVGNICGGSSNQACRANDPSNDHWSQEGGLSYAIDATYGWLPAMAASGAPF